MKVLLFVQTGDERPKCVGSGSWLARTGPFMECVQAIRDGRDVLQSQQEWRAANADRWWLVECENADAGRLIIACSRGECDSPEGCVCKNYGRILASGGRHA